MSGKAILVGAIPVSQTVEALAQQLIAKYPTGFLSEIVWPCGAAIRILEGGCLDSLRAIIRGSYRGVRTFEIIYQRAKDAHIPFSPSVIAPAMAEAI
jgi:hypothetical protein